MGLGLGAATGGCARPPKPPAPGPSAADYRWFAQDNELSNGFSLAWVKGLSPRQAAGRLGGTVVRQSTWYDLFDKPPSRVAVTATAGWALVLDVAAGFGTEETRLLSLSRGTTVLYQYLNAELDDLYQVARDGEVRVSFEPYAPAYRQGSAPDEIVESMRRAGFTVGSPGSQQPAPTETAFALTELLTGIRLTTDLLRSRPYLLLSGSR